VEEVATITLTASTIETRDRFISCNVTRVRFLSRSSAKLFRLQVIQDKKTE